MPTALNSLPVRVEIPGAARKLQRVAAVDRQGEGEAGPRVPLLVVAFYAVQAGVATRLGQGALRKFQIEKSKCADVGKKKLLRPYL